MYIPMQFTVKREYAILLQLPMRTARMCVNCTTYENKRDENRKSILIKMFTGNVSRSSSRCTIIQSLNNITLGKKNNIFINDSQYRILRWISRWLEMDELLFYWEPELNSTSFMICFQPKNCNWSFGFGWKHTIGHWPLQNQILIGDYIFAAAAAAFQLPFTNHLINVSMWLININFNHLWRLWSCIWQLFWKIVPAKSTCSVHSVYILPPCGSFKRRWQISNNL